MAIWSSEIKELEKLYESLKGQLPDLEKELTQLIHTEDANVILLYSRRCLEVIITDLCECELKRSRKTEPLKGIIDKLHKEEKVPSHIISSMYSLNELSTYGTHPKDFDPEQVKPVLINLDIVIKWYLKYRNIVTVDKTEVDEGKTQLRNEPLEKFTIKERTEGQEKPAEAGGRKLISILAISAIIVIAAILAYPKIFKKDTLEKLRSSGGKISVAVMPFLNMSNDTTWDVWQDGIQNELITSLTNSEELTVRQTETINSLIKGKSLTNYASITPSIASNISRKLDANVFIYGSIKEVDKTIRINAQLIDAKTKASYKSFQIDGTAINILHIIDSLSAEIKNFLIISKIGKENIEFQAVTSTKSPEAYKYYIFGKNAYYNQSSQTAINWLNQACDIDTNFTWAMWFLSVANQDFGFTEEAKKWALKLYKKKNTMPEREKLWVCYQYSQFFQLPEAIKFLRQLEEYDNQFPLVNICLGWTYLRLQQYDNAIREYEKAFEIYNSWDSKPAWALYYQELGYAYHKTGLYKKEKAIYKIAELNFTNDPNLIYGEAILSIAEGDKDATSRNIERFNSVCNDNSWSEARISGDLAQIYSEGGIMDKAEEYFRKSFSLEPENPVRMNDLAYFLIDKDRNIKGGMELIDKALSLSPDHYKYLHTKGWGLYKQGRYREALDILQKSWDIRRVKAVYDHEAYLHLEAAKKAVGGMKQ